MDFTELINNHYENGRKNYLKKSGKSVKTAEKLRNCCENPCESV
jgi:hypothetical protein